MATTEESNLRTLISKRGNLKSRVTRFKTYIDNVQADHELGQISLRRERVQPTWEEFEEIQLGIELLDPTNPQQHTIERQAFEDSYFEVMAAADRCIIRMRPASAPTSVNVQPTSEMNSVTQVKLPTINLPSFNGAYDQWLTFVDTFQSLIHENTNLSPIQKLHYLRSALTEEAAQVIHSLEISANNYEVAWDLLKERYQNTRIIVQNHVKALFELPIILQESHSSLRTLLDNVSRHLRALKSLNQPTESWDTIIIHILTSKFDQITKREWESTVDAKQLPTMIEMNAFLQKRCHLLHSIQEPASSATRGKSTSLNNNKIRHNFKGHASRQGEPSHSFVTSQQAPCPKCTKFHFIFHCKDFLKMSVHDRFKEAKTHNLCLNCLRPDHHANQCPSGNCRICSRKHNSLLHFVSSEDLSSKNLRVPEPQPTPHGPTVHHSQWNQEQGHVILSTVVVLVCDNRGRTHQCRALLDSGSQSNFVTKELAHKLRLKGCTISLPVTGVNQAVTHVNKMTRTNIKSRFNNFQANLEFLVVTQITEKLPALQLDRAELNIPHNINLADPQFHVPATIDMLLGAEVFWEILCAGQIKSSARLPILQKTQFGWIVSGKFDPPHKGSQQMSRCHTVTNSTLQQQLSRFWTIEELPTVKHLSNEETSCEEHFVKNTFRDAQGRFVVKLPLRSDPISLGESRYNALKRFQHLERKLSKDNNQHKQYARELHGYQQLGHMETVPDSETHFTNAPICYLPHHGVIKESSTSTKLRVVFDGSAATSNGVSLNDLLMVGPTIQEDLYSIVARFRTHRYVITADITKMYRQILIHPGHRDLQRILWRDNPQLPMETFRIKTVTFGTASAPFLATRCLQQLAIEETINYPHAALHIKRDFYVDDLLTGSDTVEGATRLKNEITQVLSRGGFTLHKWNSNDQRLRDPTDEIDHKSILTSDTTPTDPIKTLGLVWNWEGDTLGYRVKPIQPNGRCTKRRILTTIAEIFDPLGLAGPIIVTAKILLQQLWQLKLNWDEAIPLNLFTQWRRHEIDLQKIVEIQTPRSIFPDFPFQNIQIHGFCDSSQLAYGAALYVRTSNSDGRHYVQLICAKSRVAPLKTVSIPRLELCSALLLAQLLDKTSKALNLNIASVHLWTDSTIALAWITSSPHQWKTFVANRTSEIQELSNGSSWRHVRTHDNPADLLSRGATSQQLISSPLWWHGPIWLQTNEDQWPNDSLTSESPPDLLEYRPSTNAFMSIPEPLQLFTRYSSLNKLINVTAYCLMFKANCDSSAERRQGPLQVQERQQALTRLLLIAQQETFGLEIRQLKNDGLVHPKSKLLTLNPFLDDQGLLRVGGRLQHSDSTFDRKHQIVLPANHPLTHLIIRDSHVRQLHAGTQATLAAVRLQYWPISGVRVTKGIVRSCVRCFRSKPTCHPPIMGHLPRCRITPARPFSNSGVDFCGPFYIRDGGPRSKRKVKAYTAIFVCLATRAAHLELVSDLTTQAFLNALKRFIGRRGKPVSLCSDNATNFVGTRNELHELKELFDSDVHKNRTTSWLAEEVIQWNFIPPAAPHFGGIWEAAVKSTKHHLRRVVGDASLTFEELSTVLIQIESCLNSRPLTPLSSDVNDLSALTPGHFLIGDALAAIGEPSLTTTKINRLSRWQRLQQMTQHFWTRWSKEYLSLLQQRRKWNRPSTALEVGNMVILKEDNTPPLKWPLARVMEVHPGQDGVVRVATVRTRAGTFKRATHKLCVLPTDD